MEIGGVTFTLHPPPSVVLQDCAPSYRHFIDSRYPGSGSLFLHIDLVLNSVPDTTRMDLVFDTGQSWSLFEKEGEYFFALRSSEDTSLPVWVARYKKESGTLTVYCGDALITEQGGRIYLANPFSYPLDQLLLMYALASCEGVLVHASGIVLHGRAYIFPGRSGAGKTTLSRQFLHSAGAEIMSDDRVVVRKISGSYQVYGTPWAGEAGIARNMHAPLGGIFFIRHSSENNVRDLLPADALKRLMPVVSIPWYDEDPMSGIFSTLESMVSTVPSYELSFTPDDRFTAFFEAFVQSS